MERYWPVIALTAVLFSCMILLLAAKPKFSGKITGSFILIAAVSGFALYGYGYTVTLNHIPLAIVRSLLSVCGMFVGKVDYSNISAAPLFSHQWVQTFFWVVHLLALYSTASAAITTIGAEALRKLRLWLSRWGNLNLIYGINEDSVEFGKQLLKEGGAVVFVDSDNADRYSAAITNAGCVLRSDPDAKEANIHFMKNIGIRSGNRKVSLYCLSKDSRQDAAYASAFLESLQALNISPSRTSLTLPGAQDDTFNCFQALGEHYGYGSVTAFQESGLVARLLVQQYPPCNTISFDRDCLATEDFHALIIGFGQMGQAVLRNLIMNGQFEGSRFRATVFAPDYRSVNGYFATNFKTILEHYDITFHENDARSSQMYDFLAQEGRSLKYVAVCAGSAKANQEIAENLMHYFHRAGLDVPVYLCGYNGVRNAQEYGMLKIHTPRVLSMEVPDRIAMAVNYAYCSPCDRTPLEAWMACDYFSRMSNRATADFIPAMLRAAGKTAEEAMAGGWDLTEAQLENLSKTEHLRWCAFHYCMGFSVMPEEEFASRAQQYQAEIAEKGSSTLRIGKNLAGRHHACLIDWDELDALSARENRITGKQLDYKAMDRENVIRIPQFLRSASDKEGHS